MRRFGAIPVPVKTPDANVRLSEWLRSRYEERSDLFNPFYQAYETIRGRPPDSDQAKAIGFHPTSVFIVAGPGLEKRLASLFASSS